MQDFEYVRPESLRKLLETLDETGGRLVAGGTDVIPRMRRDLFPASVLVDMSRVDELGFIQEEMDQITIGARTTHQELVKSRLLQDANPALVSAAASVGCVQTRNRGTLGGNLANASPAADTIPPLLVFNASLRLMRKDGERRMPLQEFLVGPGKTNLVSGEIIYSVTFPRLPGVWGAAFQKFGKRNGMAISVVSVAAVVVLDPLSLEVTDARVALGSVAPTVVRSPKAEQILIGRKAGVESIQEAARAVVGDISPISDIRSTAEYRRHAARILTIRALEQALKQAQGRLQ